MLLLGLLGTPHCAAMCGPLVLAVASRSRRLSAQLAYHAGRISTYVAIGGLVGTLAPLLALFARASGTDPGRALALVRVAISLASAALLVGLGLTRLGLLRQPAGLDPSRLPGFSTVREGMLQGRPSAVFAFGLAMGTLPCGLSWAAFARALGAGSPGAGALLVAAFAAGTVPGLLLLGLGAARLTGRSQRLLDLAGALLVLGLGLRVGVDGLAALLG
jgi:sulfite exporter TauE/SafE